MESLKKKNFIGVAWPYVNGDVHVGHLVGYMLPCDIFARYSRLKGIETLMVSGTDCHGTPITLEADKRGVTPQEIVNIYDPKFRELIEIYKISYDLFTTTTTENHKKVSQDMFIQLLENGYIFKDTTKQYYSEKDNKFLPDRYVEGECPHCHSKDQRADQCENCGRSLGMGELIDPKSKLTGSDVILKDTEHYFIDFAKLQKEIEDSVNNQNGTRDWVINEAKGWIKEGLQPRAITRDIDWGIEIPKHRIPEGMLIDNIDSKRFYVWYEAVIGYLSATIEWAGSKKQKTNNKLQITSPQPSPQGEREESTLTMVEKIIASGDEVGARQSPAENTDGKNLWESFWKNPQAKHYYFMGQDNLAFHLLFWPGQLIGTKQGYNLPDNVSIVKFLNLEGAKFSKSRGNVIDAKEIANKYGADLIRFYLSLIMPENKQTNWIWEDFKNRINGDLVGTIGNFIHRVLVFYNNKISKFENELIGIDQEVIDVSNNTFEIVNKNLDKTNFVASINEILKYATFGNQYFDKNKPWEIIKTNREEAEEIIFNSLQIVYNLRTLLTPFIPESMAKLARLLNMGPLGSEPEKYIVKKDIFKFSEIKREEINVATDLVPLFKKIEEDM